MRMSHDLSLAGRSVSRILKPFCIQNIATGICEASLVLILVGVVVSAVGDLMLGTIFFNVSKQLKQLKSVEIISSQ